MAVIFFKCKQISLILCTISVCLISTILFAANQNDILGLWKTYDLDGKARSVIRFYEQHGEYRADVIKPLDHQPLKTLSADFIKHDPHQLHPSTIIYGLRPEKQQWINGEVLDIASGKQYHCMVSLSDDGNTMYFHAYVFKPLFGKTIEWRRVIS